MYLHFWLGTHLYYYNDFLLSIFLFYLIYICRICMYGNLLYSVKVDQIDGKVFFDLSDQQDLDEIASLRTMERVFVTVVHLPTPDLRGQGNQITPV